MDLLLSGGQLTFSLFDTQIFHSEVPLNNGSAVKVFYLFLKRSADVGSSALQCGSEKAIGDAEHLWVQVNALYLME